MADTRLRSALEIGTAVLLGLVSVATAAGAYQASVWADQAADFTSVSQQLRDRNLSSYIAADIASYNDSELLFEALDLEFAMVEEGADFPTLLAQQDVVLRSATPGLAEAWSEWRAAGYPDDLFPVTLDEYNATLYAETVALNRVSVVAYDLSQELGERQLRITVASVVFALALLLLGVSGVNASLRVSLALALSGAGAFVLGVALTLFAGV